MVLQGPAAGRQEAVGSVRRRHVLGERRLEPHARLRDGHRPDLLQPARPRSRRASSARAPRRRSWPTSSRAKLLTMTGSRRRRADRPRRLQARRHLHGPVPAERVGAAGRHGRRLSRLVADDARRLAAGHRLSEHERKWSADHGGYDFAMTSGVLDLEPADRHRRTPRIMDIAPTVLKYFGLPIPGGHRWQAAVLSRTLTDAIGLTRDRRTHRRSSVDRWLLAGRGAAARRRSRRAGAATGSRAGRGARRSARPSGSRRCRRNPRRSRRRSSTLLVELRKLEVDRADQGRGADADRARRPPTCSSSSRGDDAASRRRCSRTRDRQRPDVEARAGAALQDGARRLLAPAARRQRPARLGRAYRTASALERIDRDRVEEHRRTLAALAAGAAALETRARELAGAAGAGA